MKLQWKLGSGTQDLQALQWRTSSLVLSLHSLQVIDLMSPLDSVESDVTKPGSEREPVMMRMIVKVLK